LPFSFLSLLFLLLFYLPKDAGAVWLLRPASVALLMSANKSSSTSFWPAAFRT